MIVARSGIEGAIENIVGGVKDLKGNEFKYIICTAVIIQILLLIIGTEIYNMHHCLRIDLVTSLAYGYWIDAVLGKYNSLILC
jgi:hypothetical protein